MEKTSERYAFYLRILKEELVPAMGCTEPIAIAYGAAKARDVLGGIPDRILVSASGNMIKNVKSVIVPNTGGLKGIEAAAAAGVVAGKPGKMLEVISEVREEQYPVIAAYLRSAEIRVEPLETDAPLDFAIWMQRGENTARVRITDTHTGIVSVEHNGETVFSAKSGCEGASEDERASMSVAEILEFAESVDTDDVREILSRQIACNVAIAEEGLKNDWGANVGSVLLKTGDTVSVRARAWAAAGSDARMSGCGMPVVINSGSGNQGITVSVPVYVYAKENGVGEERLYRALVLSNLLAIHQKTAIGRLSAYCGAVSAGAAAGAGIAYLTGGGLSDIAHTLVNALAVTSGIICDGAKPSCAGKIAAAVDAGILGMEMYRAGQQFYGGDGILSKGVEHTIANVGRVGKDGMRETDKEIIRIMTGC
ncbi:MAG: L-serine ammonia-lyase, iron-sulfur-dependent, subunit alpha [Clostridia bacterium]|nr:L-serine ammonia-lyase, iron-sulfur-dependent, subunit alpha [Clostridia bacterium]